ncbi:uncharacterized protein CC84DRAFT_731273 [Paraphaeosphaeria sporulosa]|uniref:Uncharacterized protein n=1 Tax=Paraphaeosphaeria sporulosa TaxID=1460663 RepID=A0A177CFF9_9PLEO|nr:uncharacterized protein CC84DRAFT_731273 [Paraphaeosphaeria sporulosa]OAG05682.1 hypothetical protein CC84DRAFT_731273 [Paraphaeosphaeria sporulosa]
MSKPALSILLRRHHPLRHLLHHNHRRLLRLHQILHLLHHRHPRNLHSHRSKRRSDGILRHVFYHAAASLGAGSRNTALRSRNPCRMIVGL